MRAWLQDWGLPVAVGVLLIGLFVTGKPHGPQLESGVPGVELTSLDGKTWRTDDLKGRPLVVNFWATWCAPCKVEVPDFSAFAAQHPGVDVLGVTVESLDKRKIAQVAGQWGVTYPIVQAEVAVADAFEVSAFPTTIVLAEDGTVLRTHVGPMTKAQLEDAVGL